MPTEAEVVDAATREDAIVAEAEEKRTPLLTGGDRVVFPED